MMKKAFPRGHSGEIKMDPQHSIIGRTALGFVACITGIIGFIGCEPKEPGTPIGNQPPVVRISVAPLDTSRDPNNIEDHFLASEPIFRLQWFGSDPDGEVIGYYLQVDAGERVWTRRGDTTLALTADQPDPTRPGQTLPATHTIRVWAVDNEGLESSPAVRTFKVVNSIPRIERLEASFPESASVGQGISFSVDWSDPNPSGIQVLVKVDTIVVADWVNQTSFRFADLSDPTLTSSLDPLQVKVIDKNVLTPGYHIITVKIRDWGLAESDPVTRSVLITPDQRPTMTAISFSYGGLTAYPDGSVFYLGSAVCQFTMTGSASHYFGSIQGYQYRVITALDSNPNWSDWGGNSVELRGLAAGEYAFQARCRDYAGNVSDPMEYRFRIVEADFSEKRMVVVDETRDGNGRPGSPNDEQVDQFYRAILGYDTASWRNAEGWSFSEVDYAAQGGYVSPLNIARARILLWHGDDRASLEIKSNTQNQRLLREYLDRGGILILSGWDVMGNFTDADSAVFTSGFVARYLRIAGASRKNDRVFIGARWGTDSLQLDRDKIPGAWTGLDRCWAIYPAHRSEIKAVWYEGTPLAGASAVVLNKSPVNPWRTLTFGFPLYFTREDQATRFIRTLINELTE